MNKLRFAIIGGLGDVSLIRKYPVFFNSDLSREIEIAAIADIYNIDPTEREKFRLLMDQIKRERLKSKPDPNVEYALERGFSEKKIKYYRLDKENPNISLDMLEGIDVFDISVPNGLHFPITFQILTRSSAHVILEKPVVSSLEEAIKLERVMQKTNTTGRIIMDAEHYSHYDNIMEYLLNFKRFCSREIGGRNLGKVKNIDLVIEEDEDFSSERNRTIIEIKKSGGGIGLDTGIHALAFLRNIGAEIDFGNIRVSTYKSHDPRIQDERYGETAMEAKMGILEGEYFAVGCTASISVAKCCAEKRKRFVVTHENGEVTMDVLNKTLTVTRDQRQVYQATFKQDAFYSVFDTLYRCITNGEMPFSSVKKAIENVKDAQILRHESGQPKHLEKGQKYSAIP